VCALLAGLATIVSGCGTQTRPPLRLADWLSYDAVRKAAAGALLRRGSGRIQVTEDERRLVMSCMSEAAGVR
jgi:hypothetical protein